VTYTVWIQVVKRVYGSYPYPVLNKLPHPHGFVAFAAVGFALFGAAFAVRAYAAVAVCGMRACVRKLRMMCVCACVQSARALSRALTAAGGGVGGGGVKRRKVA
jgi:hypothetical protein